jgi:hypothetical protein
MLFLKREGINFCSNVSRVKIYLNNTGYEEVDNLGEVRGGRA